MAADNLDNVIAGAIAEAREGGLVGETDNTDDEIDTTEVDTDDESADEGDGEGEEEAGAEKADKSADTEDADEGETEEDAEEEDADEGEEEEDTEEDTEEDEESYDDALAKDLGIKKGKDGKYNWTAPVSKVKAVVQAREAKAVQPILATVAKIYGVDPSKVTAENLEENLGYTVQEVLRLRGRTETYDNLEPLMMSRKPEELERFVTSLVKLNPALGAHLASGGEERQAKKTPAADNDPEPQPDKLVKIGDQEVPQYSKAKWAEREAWLRRQITREVTAELDEKYEGRLKPFEDMVKSSEEHTEAQTALKDRIDDLMTEARTWENFDDNEVAIQAQFRKISKENPRLPMEKVMMRAYQKVVIGKLKAGKQKVREEVLEENRNAPKATSVAGGGKKKVAKVSAPAGSDDSMTNIIRQQIAKGRASGAIK